MLQKIIKLFQPNSNKDDTYEFIIVWLNTRDFSHGMKTTLD